MITLFCTLDTFLDIYNAILVLQSQYQEEGLSSRRTVDWILEDLREDFEEKPETEFVSFEILQNLYSSEEDLVCYLAEKTKKFSVKYKVQMDEKTKSFLELSPTHQMLELGVAI